MGWRTLSWNTTVRTPIPSLTGGPPRRSTLRSTTAHNPVRNRPTWSTVDRLDLLWTCAVACYVSCFPELAPQILQIISIYSRCSLVCSIESCEQQFSVCWSRNILSKFSCNIFVLFLTGFWPLFRLFIINIARANRTLLHPHSYVLLTSGLLVFCLLVSGLRLVTLSFTQIKSKTLCKLIMSWSDG